MTKDIQNKISKKEQRKKSEKKASEVSLKKKKQSESDSDSVETDSDNDEMNVHEYRKFLAKIFPSKHLNQKIKAGENLKNEIVKQLDKKKGKKKTEKDDDESWETESAEEKSSKKKKVDEAMIKLKEMKAQFEEDFKKEVLRLHESGEIDFSKYGWVQLLAEKIDEQPQIVGRRVRKLLPNFFVEHCFSREYTKCRRNMERNRPDEDTDLKSAAG